MSALNRLQKAFAEDLWGSDLQHLKGLVLDGRLPAARLFQVYRNNVRISLREALESVYPVILRLVGDDFFAFLADRYLRAHPSHSGDLLNFGDRLAAFLTNFKPAAGLPYLPDVARLEWAYHSVFHSPDVRSFDAGELGRLPDTDLPRLRFAQGSTCRLVTSLYPIFQIWQGNRPEIVDPPEIDISSGAEPVLVVRLQGRVKLWALEAGATQFLHRLFDGDTLEQAVEAALVVAPQFDLQSVLSGYLAAGVLVPKTND